MVSEGRCTARAACRHFDLHRSTFSYRAKAPSPWLGRLKEAIRHISNEHMELGYAKVTTMRGGKLRMLNVIDEYTRECLCIHVDRKINAHKVRQIMGRLIEEHGAPENIRSDNGSVMNASTVSSSGR